jgi:putative transposase
MKVKYRFDKTAHAVFTLNYHLIQCIKYRKKVLINDAIIDDLKQRTRKIADVYGIKIINQECDKDHTRILFSAAPSTDLLKFINNWKSATSKAIQHGFPEVKEKLWKGSFWSDSYCLLTTGQATLDQLEKYVESQGEK